MASGFGAVGLGATLAGGMLSAFGAQKEASATQQAYNYKAQVAKINADIDRQNATWALSKGETEAMQYGMKAAQQRGAIRAAQGASGLDVNSGSNVEVQQSQEKIKNMDMGMIRKNAAKIAYDYTTKAYMDENQASLDIMAGENAKEAGNIKALGSILGTTSTVASKWQQGSSTGLWG
jgi:hypothetical protein